MAQKVIKIGSSHGVTLPKRLLDKLELNLGDEIELNYNSRHDSIEIIKIKEESTPDSQSLIAEVKSILSEYKEEFEKLNV